MPFTDAKMSVIASLDFEGSSFEESLKLLSDKKLIEDSTLLHR